jgi:hypothetical protein
MEKLAFTRVNLSNVIVIMVIMHVPMIELLCQALMEQILVFKCLLLGVHRSLRPCLVMPGIKCHRIPGT